MIQQLETGPRDARHRIVLAHGAGAGMSSSFMELIAALLAERGIAVTRFEFAYMAAGRDGGPKRPPPKPEKLIAEYRTILDEIAARTPPRQSLVIGGKSLGGRIASLIADSAYANNQICGLACLGYPFHPASQPMAPPPGKPDQSRTAHLTKLNCPALIVQGERDPFGTRLEVEALALSPLIQLAWIGDGDHDFGPRGASGFTRNGNLQAAADAVAAFVAGLKPTD